MSDISPEIFSALERLFKERPRRVKRLRGGANNIVARVETSRGIFLAKSYFIHPLDRRDRLGAEFGMLSFLWKNGVRCIPQPLRADHDNRIGIYGYVKGRKLQPHDVTWKEVKQLADLLATMWNLKGRPHAASLPWGSDACFSLEQFIACTQERMESVYAAAREPSAPRPFKECVRRELGPLWDRVRAHVIRTAKQYRIPPDRVLSSTERTLSPADHGFHNALQLPGGNLIFLDFEYAGWDDPVQMLGNACLQPDIPMPEETKHRFLMCMLERLNAGRKLIARLHTVYPLLAFKWILIMLNEFLPTARERRSFSGQDPAARQARQLAKAVKRAKMVKTLLEGNRLLEGMTVKR